MTSTETQRVMTDWSENRSVMDFLPAELYQGKVWYVQYSIRNPYLPEKGLVKKRIKFNKIKNLKLRKKQANILIHEINEKLYNGWNPFLEETAPKAFTKLKDALDIFIRIKKKELREASMKTYNSHKDVLMRWLAEKDKEDIYVVNFSESLAIEYMNYIYEERDVTNTTFNNYLSSTNSFWNWMKEQKYSNRNPFDIVANKRNQEKTRIIVPEHEKLRIKEHFKENDMMMYIASLLVFHCLIRPKELTFLTPAHFSLSGQIINVLGEFSKNSNYRISTIPDVIIDELIKWDFGGAKSDQFIFGHGFHASYERMGPGRFTKKWDRMRDELQLDKNIKFYSLRDSGIVQMLIDGIPAHDVMKQADHSSLVITTKYVKYATPGGINSIKKQSSEF
jgi:integrase